jgi:hypothetical protein
MTYVGLCFVNTLKQIDFDVIDQSILYSGRVFVSAAFLQWSPVRDNNAVGHVTPMGAMRNVHTILDGTIEYSAWMTFA